MTNEPRPTSEDFKDDVKEKVRNVTEQIDLAADQVVDRVKELVNEGNIRSIRVKHDGKTIVEIPHVTIEVERTGPVEEIKETVIELKNDLTTKEPGTGEGI
jgi:DNA-binding Lrp family transcriptional regulator